MVTDSENFSESGSEFRKSNLCPKQVFRIQKQLFSNQIRFLELSLRIEFLFNLAKICEIFFEGVGGGDPCSKLLVAWTEYVAIVYGT